jgi:hypothetical protein
MSVGSPTQVSYYSSSTQVLQAKQELEASFDIPKILKPIEAVYQDALKMVAYHSQQTTQQLRLESIPLSVTLQLIDLLGMDQIQYGKALKSESSISMNSLISPKLNRRENKAINAVCRIQLPNGGHGTGFLIVIRDLLKRLSDFGLLTKVQITFISLLLLKA